MPYITGSIIILIIIYILLNSKKKNPKWNFILCLGLLPYIYISLGAIYSFFNGSGLGDSGGFLSAIFVTVVYLIMFWYIYVPAFILIILAIINIKKQNNK